jgi:hypothetical protein
MDKAKISFVCFVFTFNSLACEATRDTREGTGARARARVQTEPKPTTNDEVSNRIFIFRLLRFA